MTPNGLSGFVSRAKRVWPRGSRVRTPTVLQMEAVECGAAALAMVLAYHGRVAPLEEVRVACGVSRDGSKASRLLKAAEGYGLTACGYKVEPHEVGEFSFPQIVHWNFNHFVVLEGIGRTRVYINDPASGPRTVSQTEFDQAFTGIALTFTPSPEFRRGGERNNLAHAVRTRLRGSLWPVAFVCLAGLLLVIPGIAVPAFSRVFVDDVLVKGLTNWVTPLLLVMALTALMLGVLTWLQQWYLGRLETKLALKMSSEFFWHVLRLPIRFFTQRYAGEIGARVAINDRIAQVVSGEFASTVLSIVMVTFYALLMFQYDVTLAIIGIANALINLAILRHASRRRTDLSRRLLRDQGKLMGMAMGGLQSIETLKAMGTESDFFTRWSGQQARVLDAQQQLQIQTELLAVAPPLLFATSTTLILVVGGLRVIDGSLSMGLLVAFQTLMAVFIAPVNRLFDLGSSLQEARGLFDRVDDVLRADTDPQAVPAADHELPDVPMKLTGHVELRDVTFAYGPLDPPLIEQFNLVLKPGSRVALVGGSGSGKTTIARLVCGLYQPLGGEILFDGVPRSRVPPWQLTSSFAVVDQEIFLFQGTVKENLAMWDTTAPESAITQAAIDACIHDDISARPGGYTGVLDEGGRNLSGGQRQRLEIARALVSNPSILVLDEATSALDPISEQRIDDNLRRRGCTCLLIAHRLSTIRDCDEIIVLERGRIVQRGRHDELKDAPGPYRRLIAAE
jgi:NHLM bacteriocin system ABC transporter peptidase/ATP-binding protein